MSGKRAYCILGVMLLSFASLGAGVAAGEQHDEQTTDLEELGILELSYAEGVLDALVTHEAVLALIDADEDDLPGIESLSVSVALTENGELVLEDFVIDFSEERSDEISISIELSDELVELLHEEDIDAEELLHEVGFGDDLGLDDFNPEAVDDYWGSQIYWADEAYQVRGSQDDYDAVMESVDPEEEFERVLEDFENNYDLFAEDTFGSRLHWADDAYQIRGSQDDYDRVMDAEDPEEEFHRVLDEADNETAGPEELERDMCERGTIEGIILVDADGNGTIEGLAYNEDGEEVGYLEGVFNADGFAHGIAGENVTSADVMWKAVYMDGQFKGMWKMIDENDSARGVLKGNYDVNETGEGVFEGKWKETDCGCNRGESDVRPPVMDDMRHPPLRIIDSERIDARQVEKTPAQKPIMQKIGEVMDEPLVEDESGTIVNVGDAAAGSAIGTIAMLGAGFIRRRITGGL